MLNPNQNIDEFPELDLTQLKKYAKKWIVKYPMIQIVRILLHRIPTRGQEAFRDKKNSSWPTAKYAVIFEFSNCDELSIKNIWKTIQSFPFWKKVRIEPHIVQRLIKISFRNFLGKIELGQKPYLLNINDDCFRFFQDVNQLHSNKKPHPFIDAVFFRRVYTERIPRGKDIDGHDLRAEWYFRTVHVSDNYLESYTFNENIKIIYQKLVKKDYKRIQSETDKHKNAFIFRGDYCTVIYNGVDKDLKITKGLKFIALLIERKDEKISAHFLERLAEGSQIGERQQKAEEIKNVQSDYKIQDYQDLKVIKNAVYKLIEQRDKCQSEGENDEYIEVKTKLKKLINLYADDGLQIKIEEDKVKIYKNKRLIPEAKKSYNRVYISIHRAIKKIESKLPLLAKHLKNNIRKGSFYIYSTDEDAEVNWFIQR